MRGAAVRAAAAHAGHVAQQGCTAGTVPAALHSMHQKVLAQADAMELRTLHMLSQSLQAV